MWIRKGFSFKLTPDGAQARKMSRFAGCTRFVYNKGIAWNEEQRNADSNFWGGARNLDLKVQAL